LTIENMIQVRRIPDFSQTLVVHSWWLRRIPWLKRISDWYTYADSRPYPINAELDCESINGSCFMVRRHFLEEIGYLDEGTFLYHEEIILGKQIQDRAKKACLVTSTAVLHNQGATTGHGQGKIRLNMMRYMVNSEVHYCRKYLRSSPMDLSILVVVRGIDILGKAILDALRIG
jgi:GT2 family glycosyltransferase